MDHSDQIDLLSLLRSLIKKGLILMIIPVVIGVGAYVYLHTASNQTYKLKASVAFEPDKQYTKYFGPLTIPPPLLKQKLLDKKMIRDVMDSASPEAFGQDSLDGVLQFLDENLNVRRINEVEVVKKGSFTRNLRISLSLTGLPNKKAEDVFPDLLKAVTEKYEKEIRQNVKNEIDVTRGEFSHVRGSWEDLFSGKKMNLSVFLESPSKKQDEKTPDNGELKKNLLSDPYRLAIARDFQNEFFNLRKKLIRLEQLKNNLPSFEIDAYMQKEPSSTARKAGLAFAATTLLLLFVLIIYELIYNIERHEVSGQREE